ncbi:TonB-dependent receptor [Aquimarina sp. ERC-38]|uniref:TonB-dependent receptor n=1 Tax=Aquimarina sp. ERC-38 TaxID=2949996 RepID=UPI002248105B|nr:TonB-dependent receptor [Aquimarina sp. ERC-38]UZO80146.1 TonB-dependent receptor [Aquimarina sp. ERC-38]
MQYYYRYISSFILIVWIPVLCISQTDVNALLSQKQSLTAVNQSLQEVLNQLERKGGVTFAYAENTVDLQRMVSIDIKQKPILDILQQLFSESGYAFKNIGKQILIYKEISKESVVLNGYVKEKNSRESLSEATIYLPELQIGTITNNYGFFSIKIPKGTYEVVTSTLSYQENRQVIIMDADKEVIIALDIVPETMDEVVITASSYDKPGASVRMSNLRLTSNQLEITPVVLGEKDIFKTMQLLPGIQSGTEGSAQVLVRGGSPDQNLTILDEATVYNSNHLFGFISVYNVDAVKSTKVYKGAFPASYGGRLSSVTNITMKDGNKESFSGAFNIGLLSSSFLLEGPIQKNKTSFIFSGRRSFADLLIRPFQQNNSNPANLYFYDMNVKLHHILNKRNNLYISSYFGEDAFTTSSEEQTRHIEQSLSWGNVTTTARWNHQYSNSLFSNLSLIYSNYNLKAGYKGVVNTENNNQNEFQAFSRINDYSIKASFDYYPNLVHSINFGLESTLHKFVPERKQLSLQTGTISSNEQRLNSLESAIYIEDQLSLSQKLTAILGARGNYFAIDRFNTFSFEPRLSLAYQFKPNYTWKASYTRMNQFVHLLSNSGTGLPTDLWVSSTRNVAPQQAQQYVLGVAKDFTNTGYSLEVEGYYKEMNNIIAYKENASFLNIQNLQTGQNVNWEDNITSGKGWAYGMEWLLRKQKGKLQGWLGYTLSWSERQFDELNRGKLFFDKYDQRHNIALVSTYTPSEKVTWSASWIYRSGINFTVPDFESPSVNNDFSIGIGSPDFLGDATDTFTTQRNNIRGEATHRLNLGVQFHKKTKKNNLRTWQFSIYNIYARKNPFYYYVSDGNSSPIGIGNSSQTLEKSLRRVSVLVFIPSINYSYTF